ncbi:MAG: hypothetical protein AB8A37_05680 [Prochlorococcus sp.]
MAIPQIGVGGDVSNSIRFSGSQSCALDRPDGLLTERRALQLSVHWWRNLIWTARDCNHRFMNALECLHEQVFSEGCRHLLAAVSLNVGGKPALQPFVLPPALPPSP